MSQPWFDEDALAEAVSALRRLADQEDDRRKGTDGKLATAQATVGLIVSLSSGSLALYFFQSPHLDAWRGLAAIAFVLELFFFHLRGTQDRRSARPNSISIS